MRDPIKDLVMFAAAVLVTLMTLVSVAPAKVAEPKDATYAVVVTYCQGKVSNYSVAYMELMRAKRLSRSETGQLVTLLEMTIQHARNMMSKGKEPSLEKLHEWTDKAFQAIGVDVEPRVYEVEGTNAFCQAVRKMYPDYPDVAA